MKKLNYLLLLVTLLIISCSKDSTTPDTPATYSVVGTWKTTSAKLNGVELLGGTNPVKSETSNLNANGSLNTQSYSDTNYATLLSYSTGTYTIPNSSTINMSANAYSSSGALTGSYNFSCQVLLINATQLQLKVLNYPAANDVYIKTFVR